MDLNGWMIAGIVVFTLFFVLLPNIIFIIIGVSTVKMLKRSKNDVPFNKALKERVDISFFNKGPMKPLVEEGRKFILENLKGEDLFITSFDKIKLHGYFYKNTKFLKSKKYFIGFHGFKSGPIDEYAPYVKDYLNLGFNIVLVDERAHHKSEGKYSTLGCKEKYDVLYWANYLVEHFGKGIEILVQGVSMGATSVVLASTLDLPKQVIGIISDCPYASIEQELRFQMKKINCHIPVNIIIPPVKFFMRMVSRIDFKKSNGIDAVKESKKPILFIHGKKDEMVPYNFSEKLFDACTSKKKLLLVENANHGESYGCNRKQYIDNIKEFFNIKDYKN